MKIQLFFYTLGFVALSFLCLSSCRYNNVKVDTHIEDIIKKNGFSGSFILMDNTHGEFTLSNVKMDTMRVLSSNAISLLYALIALELGEVSASNETSADFPVSIDSLLLYPTPSNIKAVYRAFDTSKLQEMVNKLFYGNMKISPDECMISVDEQLGFLKKIYFNQLSISTRSMKIIKEAMQKTTKASSEQSTITLIPVNAADEQASLWQMGWLEYEKEFFFFVLNLGGKSSQSINQREGRDVLSEILNYLSIKEQHYQL